MASSSGGSCSARPARVQAGPVCVGCAAIPSFHVRWSLSALKAYSWLVLRFRLAEFLSRSARKTKTNRSGTYPFLPCVASFFGGCSCLSPSDPGREPTQVARLL